MLWTWGAAKGPYAQVNICEVYVVTVLAYMHILVNVLASVDVFKNV